MLISLCIPNRNRTYDLKYIMPRLLDAAATSPPVEIVVVDYNSTDDLHQYMMSVMEMPIDRSIRLVYRKYTGRDYYHMAHARNLSVLAASGEYFVILSADIWIDPEFLPAVRKLIAENQYVWMEGTRYKGVICCRRQEFIAAGGYDERYEFYGPEDRDLALRLYRRGGKTAYLPSQYVHVIQTPDEVKVQGYRLPISKREMSRRMARIYEENNKVNEILVANEGVPWGRWE